MEINRKAHYNRQGLYVGYDKKNKEREALDYYSTPTEEVLNILETLDFDFSNTTILEPCAGGGHMLLGIWQYLDNKDCVGVTISATDIQKRELCNNLLNIKTGKDYDFLSENYPYSNNIDYIIMNPPYSVIEPFVMKALGIANKGIIMLGRLQFLEGEKRYENILKENPPTDIYVYVDRISCYKNGDTTKKQASAQAYAWFIWNFEKDDIGKSEIHFIRREDKRED